MRIVGGKWKGRRLCTPQGERTRPTSDRVREALFSAMSSRLGNDLGGGRVLDAFSGSGALGLEALSRGAASCTFVERDRAALAALRRNIGDVAAESVSTVLVGDVFSLAARVAARGPFTLILLDPPYTLDSATVAGLLDALAQQGAVARGALVSWEHATGRDACWPPSFRSDAQKRYGTTTIDIGTYERGANA